ncbi:MAG: dethiobiotin synthase [Gammaproteobacteria bacterium]
MKTKYLYMMGASSGVGKSTLCEGLLSQLLANGYRPDQLAYIKPMTQCLDKQPVTLFCEREKICHRGIDSIVFRKGYTKDFIDGLTENSWALKEKVLASISQISENREIVIVDGIGNPATGSVIGLSNADIALSIAAPVVFVGKAGIGSTIDDTVLSVSFLRQKGIDNIALVYNKIPTSEFDLMRYYLSKRLSELLPDIPVLDFIPAISELDQRAKHESAGRIHRWLKSLSTRSCVAAPSFG